MIDFNSYTVVELRQWIKEYQEKNNTSFTGLSKMRKAELVELANTLNDSVEDKTQEEPMSCEDTQASDSPNTVEIYNSLNRKQKRKFNKLCKGAIVLDDTEVTWERLASCF